MPIKLTLTDLPGGAIAELEVGTMKEIFENASLLQQLPTICPFDGSRTVFDFTSDDKGHKYYGVKSKDNPQFSFKLGTRMNGGGALFPVGWTLYDAEIHATWFWVPGLNEWCLKVKDDKAGVNRPDTKKVRSKLHPQLPLYKPIIEMKLNVDYTLVDDGEEEAGLAPRTDSPADNRAELAKAILALSSELDADDTRFTAFVISSFARKTKMQNRNTIEQLSLSECEQLLHTIYEAPARIQLFFVLEDVFGNDWDGKEWVLTNWCKKRGIEPKTKVSEFDEEQCEAIASGLLKNSTATLNAWKIQKAKNTEQTGK